MLFLQKEEKILLLLYRIEMERIKTLFGHYKSYSTGENKISKMRNKIVKLGGNPDVKVTVEES